MSDRYDSLLVVGFGGPDHPDDVMPFLRNVVRGRDVSQTRLAKVAAQYERVGGVSPINAQTADLAHALRAALGDRGVAVPVHVGNRNWHPFLADTLEAMADQGSTSVLAVATSAFSSHSGCRQYLDNIDQALRDAGLSDRMTVAKIPPFWDVPGFLAAVAERIEASLADLDAGARQRARLIFTAHSIPVSVAATSEYQLQLDRAAAIVAERVGLAHDFVFQSRSGPPHLPWLEPDIVDHLATVDAGELVVVVPLGFLSDHAEVLFDLDIRATEAAAKRGIEMVRVPTVGTHPTFTGGLADALVARFHGDAPLTMDGGAPRPFPCAANCCPAPPPS